MSGFIPHYHLVSLLDGVAPVTVPLLPATKEAIRQWSEDAARECQPIESIYMEYDGNTGKVLDAFFDAGEPKAFVKFVDETGERYTQIVDVQDGQLDYSEETKDQWISTIMPRLQPRKVLPVRLKHRDDGMILNQSSLAGRFLDVWVNPKDEYQVLAYVGLDASPVGMMLHMMIMGNGLKNSGAMTGFSIEIGEDNQFRLVEGKLYLAELTGGIFTKIPRMRNSRQQVEIDENRVGIGGSVFSICIPEHTSLKMSNEDKVVEMTTTETAIQEAEKMHANQGEDEHSRAVKRAKDISGDPVKDLEERAMRAEATADYHEAREAVKNIAEKVKYDMQETLKMLLERNPAIKESVDVIGMTMDSSKKDHVVTQTMQNPQMLINAVRDFDHEVSAMHREELAVEKAVAAKLKQIEEERNLQKQKEEAQSAELLKKEQEREQELANRARDVLRRTGRDFSHNYSTFNRATDVGSSSSSSSTSSSSVRETNPVPDFKSSGTYEEDQTAVLFNSINSCMITPMSTSDNFSHSGGASHTDRLSYEISTKASGLAEKTSPYLVARALSGLVSSPSSSSKRRRS